MRSQFISGRPKRFLLLSLSLSLPFSLSLSLLTAERLVIVVVVTVDVAVGKDLTSAMKRDDVWLVNS